MARIRSIKVEFWAHEGLSRVSRDARLFFIGLWNFADDAGRARAHPSVLKGQIFPYDEIDVVPLLCELEEGGFVRRYVVDGQAFLCIPGWARHQVINKPSNTRLLPGPPGDDPTPPPEPSGSPPVALPEPDGSPTPRKGREGKGKEGNGEEHAASPKAGSPPAALPGLEPDPPSPFVAFVREYWPDVKAPVDREREWQDACPAVNLLAEARKALSWERESPRHRKTDHASFLGNWLRRAQDNASKTQVPFQRGTGPPRAGAHVVAREPEVPRVPGRKQL